MIKTKKLNKQSIAIIILSIVLGLAVIFGITAAWFTDTNTQEGSVTTGVLNLKIQHHNGTAYVDGAYGASISNAVPGDIVLPKMQIVKDSELHNVSAYIRIKVEITTTKGEDTLTNTIVPAAPGTGWVKDGDYYYYGTSVSALTVYTGAAALPIYENGFVLPTTTGDAYQGSVVSISVIFEATQSAHNSSSTVWKNV